MADTGDEKNYDLGDFGTVFLVLHKQVRMAFIFHVILAIVFLLILVWYVCIERQTKKKILELLPKFKKSIEPNRIESQAQDILWSKAKEAKEKKKIKHLETATARLPTSSADAVTTLLKRKEKEPVEEGQMEDLKSIELKAIPKEANGQSNVEWEKQRTLRGMVVSDVIAKQQSRVDDREKERNEKKKKKRKMSDKPDDEEKDEGAEEHVQDEPTD